MSTESRHVEESLPSGDLARLLTHHRDEIQAAWLAVLSGPSGQGLTAMSRAEGIDAWTEIGLSALIDSLRSGLNDTPRDLAEPIRLASLRSDLDAGEVTTALLCLKEAILPVVFRAHQETPDRLESAISALDTGIRLLVAELSASHTNGMRQALARERGRTATMLDAVSLARRTDDVRQVLKGGARSIASALALPYCGIFWAEENGGTFELVASHGELTDDHLRARLTQGFDSTSDPLLRIALNCQRAQTFGEGNGEPLLDRTTCDDLGIAAACALPVSAHGHLLALALAIGGEHGDELHPDQIELALGIANALAPAVETARLRIETRRQIAESRSLQHETASLLEKIGLSSVLEAVCSEAQALTGATGSAVYLRAEGDRLEPAYSAGDLAPRAGTSGVEPLPARVEDGQEESLLTVPLTAKCGVIGTLQLFNRSGDFDKDESRVARLFADQAAIAIEHAQLHEQQEKVRILEERQRLARDLHDSVTQSLYGVTMFAEAASRLIAAGETSKASEILTDLRSTGLEALREMRLLLFELRPPSLAEEGLIAVIQARLAAVEGRAGLKTEFRSESADRLPRQIEDGLHRIAQETLNNSLKHAHAARISVTLRRSGESVTLEIVDDGSGFDIEESKRKGGLGLRGMEERAAQLGGHLMIMSRPGTGTRVKVMVPINEASEE